MYILILVIVTLYMRKITIIITWMEFITNMIVTTCMDTFLQKMDAWMN